MTFVGELCQLFPRRQTPREFMASVVDRAVNAIIRPPRKAYDPLDIPIIMEGANGERYVRHPIAVMNSRSQQICGSIYVSTSHNVMDGGPCIFYMHGNASSQLEGQFLIPNLCPKGIAVYCFDFVGCGASDGDYVSLGHYESIDTDFLIRHLAETFGFGPFFLWGRSMGAGAALLVRHPLVAGRILDSAYVSISGICEATAHKIKVPSIFIPGAELILKVAVQSRASFDLTKVCPLDSARAPGNPPCVIGHAHDDAFIPFAQGDQIFREYSNADKTFVTLAGGHNGKRPLSWIGEGCRFVMRILNIDATGYQPTRLNEIRDAEDHFMSYEDLLHFMGSHAAEAEEQQRRSDAH
jgi:hypothetical protein